MNSAAARRWDRSFRLGGRRGPLALVLGGALAVFLLDLITKQLVIRYLVVGESIPIIPGFLNLHHIKNSGAAFGIGRSWSPAFRLPFFLVVFALAAWVLWSFYQRCDSDRRALPLALGMVAGGASGNLLDRLVHGRVTDFIDLYIGDAHWPFFNLADSAITIGVAILFSELWRRPEREERSCGALSQSSEVEERSSA